LQSVTKRHKYK